jgi:hypothetical protein
LSASNNAPFASAALVEAKANLLLQNSSGRRFSWRSYERSSADFQNDHESSKAFTQVDKQLSGKIRDTSELDALTALPGTLLSMNETVSKQ